MKIITLCGSTRFKKEFEAANARLTLEGNFVISVGVYGHADRVSISEEQKEMLDKIHMRKIAMADEIFVINVGGYIGSSTGREIEYAWATGKPVRYLEKPGSPTAAKKTEYVLTMELFAVPDDWNGITKIIDRAYNDFIHRTGCSPDRIEMDERSYQLLEATPPPLGRRMPKGKKEHCYRGTYGEIPIVQA